MNGITNSMDMNLGKLQEMVRDREAWPAAGKELDTTWQLNNEKWIYMTFHLVSLIHKLKTNIVLAAKHNTNSEVTLSSAINLQVCMPQRCSKMKLSKLYLY